jgi:hypothetical protein
MKKYAGPIVSKHILPNDIFHIKHVSFVVSSLCKDPMNHDLITSISEKKLKITFLSVLLEIHAELHGIGHPLSCNPN